MKMSGYKWFLCEKITKSNWQIAQQNQIKIGNIRENALHLANPIELSADGCYSMGNSAKTRGRMMQEEKSRYRKQETREGKEGEKARYQL